MIIAAVYHRMVKRIKKSAFFDIFFSGLALIVISPLLVPIAIFLRFSGEGEVFFAQQRVGLNGKKFNLL